LLSLILEEDGKRESRGETRGWTRRREEKEYFNNIAQELMIEDTPFPRDTATC